MKHFIILFSFLLVPLLASAQPDTLWTRTWGTGYAERVSSIAALSNQEMLVAGDCDGDLVLLLVDINGDILFDETYTYGTLRSHRLDVMSDGNINMLSLGTPNIIEMTPAGQVIWTAQVATSGGAQWEGGHSEWAAHSLIRLWGGDYVRGGETWVSLNGPPYYAHENWIRCVSEADSEIWGLYPPGAPIDISETVWEGLIVAMNYQDHIGVQCYNEQRTPVSFFVFAVQDTSYATLVRHSYNDVTFVAGYSISETAGVQIELAKLVGYDMVWSRQYGGAANDQLNDIVALPDGGVVACGTIYSFGSTGNDIFVLRTDSLGNILWQTTFGGSEDDYGQAISLLQDGSYFIAGYTESFGEGFTDMYFIRTTPDPVTVTSDFIPHPSSFILSSYPNPFNPTTTISFSLPKTGDVSLKVYDVTGRLVETLAEQRFEAGEHAVTFDGSALPSGIYFARMTAGTVTQTQKMVLLK